MMVAVLSRPVRALWIEIFLLHVLLCYLFVEAREGLVEIGRAHV